MSISNEVVEGQPRRKPVKVLLAVWLLLGALPFFPSMVGFDFLPSIEWMSKSNLPGAAAGLGTAVLMLTLVVKNIDGTPGPDWKKALAVIGAPFFSFLLGRNVVVIVGPMILALIAGQQVELPFTVAHADRDGGKGCRSPLELQGLPLLFDRLCGVPDDLRQSLAPSTRVVVIGRGTSFGVYAEGFRIEN